MAQQKTTINDLLQEMETWCTFSPKMKEKAEASDIDNFNNKKFMKLVRDWSNGVYDEDPQYVAYYIESLLTNNA